MPRVLVISLSAVALIAFVFFVLEPTDPQPTTSAASETGRADPNDVYDPFTAGEELPSDYRQVIGRDDIRPIYDPTYVQADEADWPDELLVIGVEINGDARAYPVSFLTRREMVIDEIGGDPVLVTW